MKTYLILYTIVPLVPSTEDDSSEREGMIYSQLYKMGRAWSGSMAGVLLETDMTPGDIKTEIAQHMHAADLLLIIKLNHESVLYWHGMLFDRDGFDNLTGHSIPVMEL